MKKHGIRIKIIQPTSYSRCNKLILRSSTWRIHQQGGFFSVFAYLVLGKNWIKPEHRRFRTVGLLTIDQDFPITYGSCFVTAAIEKVLAPKGKVRYNRLWSIIITYILIITINVYR